MSRPSDRRKMGTQGESFHNRPNPPACSPRGERGNADGGHASGTGAEAGLQRQTTDEGPERSGVAPGRPIRSLGDVWRPRPAGRGHGTPRLTGRGRGTQFAQMSVAREIMSDAHARAGTSVAAGTADGLVRTGNARHCHGSLCEASVAE